MFSNLLMQMSRQMADWERVNREWTQPRCSPQPRPLTTRPSPTSASTPESLVPTQPQPQPQPPLQSTQSPSAPSRNRALTPAEMAWDLWENSSRSWPEWASNWPSWANGTAERQPIGMKFPRVDVSEHEDHMMVVAEVPGMDKKDVHVTVKGDVLVIEGKTQRESISEEDEYGLQERYVGSFQRQFRLPFPVNPKEVKATFGKGLVQIRIPRPPTPPEQEGYQVQVE